MLTQEQKQAFLKLKDESLNLNGLLHEFRTVFDYHYDALYRENLKICHDSNANLSDKQKSFLEDCLCGLQEDCCWNIQGDHLNFLDSLLNPEYDKLNLWEALLNEENHATLRLLKASFENHVKGMLRDVHITFEQYPQDDISDINLITAPIFTLIANSSINTGTDITDSDEDWLDQLIETLESISNN